MYKKATIFNVFFSVLIFSTNTVYSAEQKCIKGAAYFALLKNSTAASNFAMAQFYSTDGCLVARKVVSREIGNPAYPTRFLDQSVGKIKVASLMVIKVDGKIYLSLCDKQNNELIKYLYNRSIQQLKDEKSQKAFSLQDLQEHNKYEISEDLIEGVPSQGILCLEDK